MSDPTDLIQLLPAVYRIRDRAEGGPLEALLRVIGSEVALVQDSADELYDDWFVETCAEWVVPYIGDLLGVRPLLPIDDPAFTQRGYVANTVGYRRRKGTAAVLERLARDLTGWPAVAVEYFEHLATTQHVNHPRPGSPATADIRSAAAAPAWTPFESVSHTGEVRHVDNGRGAYNIPNVGVVLWRLGSYPLSGVTARQVDATRFTVDPLGGSAAVFTRPGPAPASGVPEPLSRLAMRSRLAAYYGDETDPASVLVSIGGTAVPRGSIAVCDLSDSGGGWAHTPPSGVVAVDPHLGRIAFGDAPAAEVTTSHAYGSGGDLGGGPYDKRSALGGYLAEVTWQNGVMATPPPDEPRIKTTLAEAVAEWNAQPAGTCGLIVLLENRTITEDLTAATTPIRIPAGSRLVLVSGDWPQEETGDPEIPVTRLTGRVAPQQVRTHIRGTVEVVGTATGSDPEPGTLVLLGLLLEGELDLGAGELGALHVSHCTLAPGSATFTCGENPRLALRFERSITGALALGDAAPALELTGCIINGNVAGRDVSVDSSTLLGTLDCRTLEATSSIVTGLVRVLRRQVGCVRFSYLPPASTVPRRFRCQPVGGAAGVTFQSTTFGDPAYAQLRETVGAHITEGAEGETEMGAWRFVQSPRRLRNLRAALEEYLRFGLEAGVAFARQR